MQKMDFAREQNPNQNKPEGQLPFIKFVAINFADTFALPSLMRTFLSCYHKNIETSLTSLHSYNYYLLAYKKGLPCTTEKIECEVRCVCVCLCACVVYILQICVPESNWRWSCQEKEERKSGKMVQVKQNGKRKKEKNRKRKFK